jgi:anti-anti-sigma factor
MAAVTFLSSAGITELVAAHRELEAHGKRLHIVAASPIVTRVLQVCGLASIHRSGSGEGPPTVDVCLWRRSGAGVWV